MRAAIPALGAALAAVALAAPPAAQAADCTYAGSRTVLSTPFARVYYTADGRPWSCYRITGRRAALDLHVDRYYAPRDARLGLLRISGRILGYTWIDPGQPAVYVHSVDMRLARFRRRALVQPVASAEPSAVKVTDVAVNRSGALAWIQVVEDEASVWRLDARGRRRLAVGPDIGLGSLRRVGERRIAWSDGAGERSAALS